MTARVDPYFVNELKEYGAVGVENCFNCGNCTAICPLSTDEHTFPRDMIRLSQLGLKEHILAKTDPWLCYYCGECSTTCPRQAEPAESMMALRRWQTANYDTSGHGAKLYRSETAVAWSIVRGVIVNLLLLVLFYVFGLARLVTDRVELNTVFPVMWVWAVVLIHFAYLGIRVAMNMFNMGKHVLGKELLQTKVPLSIYVSEFKTFIQHFFTQKRWKDCDDEESKQDWWKHLLFMSGYGVMLLLIVPLLWWFQTDNIYPIYHPQRWLGYYATIVLIVFSIDFLRARARKQQARHKFSHPSDWLFPSFILIGAITGILVHIFRYLGALSAAWAWPTYVIYVIHVLAMAAMLDTEVGIGKWMHMMYRPLAMYLEAVKAKALQRKESLAGAPAAAD